MLPPRFWTKVDKTDSCWLWTAARFSNGYGAFRVGSQQRRSHRVIWEDLYGPVPTDLVICHRCDVKHCVRPEHLFLGTQADNIADRDAKGHAPMGNRNGMRLHPERAAHAAARGEASGRVRYTTDEVLRWREMYATQDWTIRSWADHLGVNHNTLFAAISRRSWRHVP